MAFKRIGRMIPVQHPAMLNRPIGAMKYLTGIALCLCTTPLLAQETTQQEDYESLLSCAAFYTIEASRAPAGDGEAQQATAYDFANAAAKLAPDGSIATANADLGVLLKSYREKLDNGDVRTMAEGWTALESACRGLHRVKDDLVKQHKPDTGTGR
jgi:hypothetical protein